MKGQQYDYVCLQGGGGQICPKFRLRGLYMAPRYIYRTVLDIVSLPIKEKYILNFPALPKCKNVVKARDNNIVLPIKNFGLSPNFFSYCHNVAKV